MAAGVSFKGKKIQHKTFFVLAVFFVVFTACILLSFFLHVKILTKNVVETYKIACGQTTKTIVSGLSYGKEISNYSGAEELLKSSVMLCPDIKNVYICDINGVVGGSYIKMMDSTGQAERKSLAKNHDLRIMLHGKEMHVMQALVVDGEALGYLGAVTDIKTVFKPLVDLIAKNIGIMLILDGILALLCFVIVVRLGVSTRLICSLGLVAFLLPMCMFHLETQHHILDKEFMRMSSVMAATINADAQRLTEKGIDIGSLVGVEEYLQEKLLEHDTISVITLENKINKEKYTVSGGENITTAYTNEYSDSKFFDISVGISQEAYIAYKEKSVKLWILTFLILEIPAMLILKKDKKESAKP